MRKSLFIFAPLCFIALPVLAANNCSPQTTRGSWQYTCDGYLSPPPPAPFQLFPARILGTCTASKTADWHCTGTVNFGGTILDQGLSGHAYAQSINGYPAGPLEIRYVISDNGDTIKGLPISPDQVLSCLLNRTSNSDEL
jgi:hypothetical protein